MGGSPSNHCLGECVLLFFPSIVCKSKFNTAIKMGSLGNHQLVGLFSTWSWSFNPKPILDFLFSSLAIFSTTRPSSQKCKVSGKDFFVDCGFLWMGIGFLLSSSQSFTTLCFGERGSPTLFGVVFWANIHRMWEKNHPNTVDDRRPCWPTPWKKSFVELWGIFLNGCYCPYSWTNRIAMIFWDTIMYPSQEG